MKIGETLTIKIGGQDVVLHPTLRHALKLSRREGGIRAIGLALDEGSLDAACLVIGGHTSMPYLPNRVYDAGVERLAPLLSEYLLALLGVDIFNVEYEQVNTRNPRPPKPFAETCEWLFGIATGWLGWSPDDAWNASPMEIIAAYQGRQEMLRAIFGGADTSTERSAPQDLNIKVKAIFGRIGTVREAA